MKGKKGKLLTGGIIGAAALALAIGIGANVQAAPKKELFPIKTPTLKNCGLAPWLVTDKLGYFAEEGIKIVYTGETQPALVIPSILKGNNDVSGGHPNTIAVAKAGGAQITGVVRGGIDPAPSFGEKAGHGDFDQRG